MKDGVQQFCNEIWEAGCYALCLLSVAEEYNQVYNPIRKVDVIEELQKACSGTGSDSIIYYNKNNLNDNKNFYVQHPEKLLYQCTGVQWQVTKEYDLTKKLTGKEYLIKYYERVRTGSTSGHFDRDSFHPIIDSQTCKYGSWKTSRICRVI